MTAIIPSSGSVARRVAARLGLRFLDTGAMYRAVASEVLRRGLAPEDSESCARVASELDLDFDPQGRIWIDGRAGEPDIRSAAVDRVVSRVSGHAPERALVVERQRALARAWGGLVAEGRDMASVVFPEAQLKIYLTASSGERAMRRARQLGSPERAPEIRREIEQRDRLDTTRRCSPLLRVPEAVQLDTDGLPEEHLVERVLELAHERGLGGVLGG
jgi:cytidylate kinase